MKDSWGGVQNVWFVSPALFPLSIGAMIMVLGAALSRTALKILGADAFVQTLRRVFSPRTVHHLADESAIRFYAVVSLFVSYVYVFIPRIDFFVCSILFLIVFITLFYFDSTALLRKLFCFYLAGVAGFVLCFSANLDSLLERGVPYGTDFLALCYIGAYLLYARRLVCGNPILAGRLRTALLVSVSAPFICGPVFKYFLLVPLPKEGAIVALLDAVRYFDF